MKQTQIKFKLQNVALMEEWAIINGDSSTGSGLQFDGFEQLITTNVTDLGSTALTLSACTTTLRNISETYGGHTQFIVFAFREIQKFSELVLSSYYRLFQAGAGSMADIPAGIAITKWVSPFGTVDILGSRYICASYEKTKAYFIDDKSITNDGNAVAMIDLMPVSSIDLALLQTAYRTLVAEFSVMMITVEVFQGKMINITA